MDCFLKQSSRSQNDPFPLGYHEYVEQIENYMIRDSHRNIYVPQQFENNRHQIVHQLKDISCYSFKLLGETIEEPCCEEEEDERDEQLRRKIQRYNQITRPTREKEGRQRRSRRHDGSKGQCHKRKIRTTITQAKLDQMNKIFSIYYDYREKHKDENEEPEDEQKNDFTSLKNIGEKLGLGYSTILHKYRQFRATKKVKGGALIAAMFQKRKYKKSKKIEEYIQQSLREDRFYTAVELSKYIEQKHNIKLSRSIISRHLGEMGYSYKNIRTRPTNKNSNEIKEMRNKYAVTIKYCQQKQGDIYYLDECIFNASENLRQEAYQQSQQLDDVMLLLFISKAGMCKYLLKIGSITDDEFIAFIEQAVGLMQEKRNISAIVLDIDAKMHYNQGVCALRERVREDEISFYYIAPYSPQLNIIEWIAPKIKQNVKRQKYDNLEELRDAIENSLADITSDMIQTSLRESDSFYTRALNGTNF